MPTITLPDHKAVLAFAATNTDSEPVFIVAGRNTYILAKGRLVSKRAAINHKRQYGNWPHYPKIGYTFDFTGL